MGNVLSHNEEQFGNIVVDKSVELGSGTYGTVYEGYVADQPATRLAIKMFKGDDERARTNYEKELAVAQALSKAFNGKCNPHILCLFGHFERPSNNEYYIVYTKATSDLLSFMKSKGVVGNGMSPYHGVPLHPYVSNINQSTKYNIINTLVNALHALHSIGVTHNDISLKNILLYGDTAPYEFVLSDLGKVCKHKDVHSQVPVPVCRARVRGTRPFMKSYSYSSQEEMMWGDIYATGLILYSFLTGHTPLTDAGLRTMPLNLKEPLEFSVRGKTVRVPKSVLNKLVNTMVFASTYKDASAFYEIWRPYRNLL